MRQLPATIRPPAEPEPEDDGFDDEPDADDKELGTMPALFPDWSTALGEHGPAGLTTPRTGHDHVDALDHPHRAKWVPDGAIERDDAIARLRPVLAGQRLIVWSGSEMELLRWLDPDGGHPGPEWRYAWDDAAPAVSLAERMKHWRGQLDPLTRELVPCVPPGTPERTALLLAQVAAAATRVAALYTCSDRWA